MRITFELNSSGAWPAPIDRAAASAGICSLGPAGLLTLLETHLALLSPTPDPALRLLRYADRLRACGPGRFWSASLAVDDLGTAAAVLALRDELVAGGWSGKASGRAGRIADLAAAEEGNGSFLPGEADRARAVLAALATRGVPISELRVAGGADALPPPWPAILAALRKRGVLVVSAEGPRAVASGDLGALQRFLETGKTVSPVGDGSLVILRAASDAEAAEVLAALLRSVAPRPLGSGDGASAGQGIVLVADEDDALDGALRAHGVPSAGTAAGSRLRPALQALRLALAVRWDPPDPRRMLELLVLPGGPVARATAGKLAAALRDEPGIGTTWRETLKGSGAEEWFAGVESEPRKEITWKPGDPWEMPDELDPEVEESTGNFVRDECLKRTGMDLHAGGKVVNEEVHRKWVAERSIPRMSAETAAKVARRVAAWAGRDSDTDPVKAAAAGAAKRFAELVEARGGQLSRVQVERLLDIAAGEGVAAPDRFAQAGHVARVAHPGAILGEADTVVWWSFAAEDAPASPRSPWSRAEREALTKAGVVLEDPSSRARRDAEAWLSPIRFAKKSLVLVVPDRRAGVEAAPHPVLDRVRAAFAGSSANLELAAADVLAGRASLLGAKTAAAPVAPRTLPRARRWWTLPPGSVPARATESYSSLDSFVQSPFQWVLSYPARLRPGELGGLPEGVQLLGTLAEELILDTAGDAAFVAKASEKDVTRRVEARLPGLLAESGAILLQPGFELERERLRAGAVRAAWTLVQAMRDGKWRFEPGLKEVKGEFCGGAVMGIADMVLTRAKPPVAVLDLKWGWRSGRFKQLKENRALQLAVYAHCLREKNGPWPHIGYLIIQSAEILATSPGAFPGATDVSCAGDCADLWKAFEIRWKWRRAQLDAGKVEVITENTLPDPDSTPPAGALVMDDETPFNDHIHLCGWEEGA